MELTDKEKEIHDVVREILKDKKHLNTTLKHAVKFCHIALKSNGDQLKEACQNIVGNSIKWSGDKHQELKNKLRKFAFRSAVVYDRSHLLDREEDDGKEESSPEMH